MCGQQFHPDHALSSLTGTFPTHLHNKIRDLLVTLISEVCFDTAIEPPLQLLTGETFHRQTTTTDDGARPDIGAGGFGGNQAQNTFFNVNIFNPNVRSNTTSSLKSCHHWYEWAKWNKYEEQTHKVERASLTPPVFNTSGGASPHITTFLKHTGFTASWKTWLKVQHSTRMVMCTTIFHPPTSSHNLHPWIQLHNGPCAPWEHPWPSGQWNSIAKLNCHYINYLNNYNTCTYNIYIYV